MTSFVKKNNIGAVFNRVTQQVAVNRNFKVRIKENEIKIKIWLKRLNKYEKITFKFQYLLNTFQAF